MAERATSTRALYFLRPQALFDLFATSTDPSFTVEFTMLPPDMQQMFSTLALVSAAIMCKIPDPRTTVVELICDATVQFAMDAFVVNVGQWKLGTAEAGQSSWSTSLTYAVPC